MFFIIELMSYTDSPEQLTDILTQFRVHLTLKMNSILNSSTGLRGTCVPVATDPENKNLFTTREQNSGYKTTWTGL